MSLSGSSDSRKRSWAQTRLATRVVDRGAEEDDALLQQAGVEVVGALAPVRRLDHRRHQVVAGPHPVLSHAHHRGLLSVLGLGRPPVARRRRPPAAPVALGSSVHRLARPARRPRSRCRRSSTIATWSSSHVSALAFRCSERTAAVLPAWSSCRRRSSASMFMRSAIASSSAASSSSLTSRASASARARRARSALTADRALLPDLRHQLVAGPPGGLQELVEPDAAAPPAGG